MRLDERFPTVNLDVRRRFRALNVINRVDYQANVPKVGGVTSRVHLVLTNGGRGGVLHDGRGTTNRNCTFLPVVKVSARLVEVGKEGRVFLPQGSEKNVPIISDARRGSVRNQRTAPGQGHTTGRHQVILYFGLQTIRSVGEVGMFVERTCFVRRRATRNAVVTLVVLYQRAPFVRPVGPRPRPEDRLLMLINPGIGRRQEDASPARYGVGNLFQLALRRHGRVFGRHVYHDYDQVMGVAFRGSRCSSMLIGFLRKLIRSTPYSYVVTSLSGNPRMPAKCPCGKTSMYSFR